MKWFIMYFVICYTVACADDIADYGDNHTIFQRVLRALFWPLTCTSWFRSQNGRLHRLLNIGWVLLVFGWLLSLMADRL